MFYRNNGACEQICTGGFEFCICGCGKPTAARRPTAASRQRHADNSSGAASQLRPEGLQRQADSGMPTTRVERQANCSRKADSGSPTARGERQRRQRPESLRRQIRLPRGERQSRQRPEGKLRQSRLRPFEIEFELGVWTRPAIVLGGWQPAWPKPTVGLPTIAFGAWRRAWPTPTHRTPTIALGSGVGRGRSQQSQPTVFHALVVLTIFFRKTLNGFRRTT